jgi:branched-subunit amino acid aminotransferase/4-amino-4-deoxychorismate lyase
MDFIINGQSPDSQFINKTYLNRGFKYGDGLFETIRRMEGRYPLLTYHQERLERGLAQIGMKVPSALSGNDWAGELDKLLPNQANARLRLTVFRAGEGAYAPTDDQSHFTLEGHPLPSARLADPTKGVSSWSHSQCRDHPLPAFPSQNDLRSSLRPGGTGDPEPRTGGWYPV